MTETEKLWYLINGLLENSYEIKVFCNEFTRIYNLEVEYDKLTDDENMEFGDLCEMAERFSDDLDELKIPNMYFSANEIVEKAKKVKLKLKC